MNVLYELGLAKGMKKNCVIIRKTRTTDGLPADLRGARVHVYNTKRELESTVLGIIGGEFTPRRREPTEPKALGEELSQAVHKSVKDGLSTTSAISETLGLPGGVVRELLSELEDVGKVTKQGIKKGTRYFAVKSEFGSA